MLWEKLLSCCNKLVTKALLGSTVRDAVPFSLKAGKRKCCTWLVNKVEIDFAKIGFVNCKWSNLNASGSYTPWCHSPLESIVGCPFLCMQEKGNLHVVVVKVEIYLAKIGFVDCIWSN